MIRLIPMNFVTRIAIILIFSLIAIQILTVLGYFIQRSHNTGTGFRLPLPDQVAAIVELIEKSKPEDRPAILRAVSSSQLQAAISGEVAAPPTESWRASRRIRELLQRYLSVIKDRQVTVLVQFEEAGFLSRLAPFHAPATATIIIALNQEENLVITAAGPLFLKLYGFPPGFWGGIIGFGMAVLAIVIIRREARPLRRLAQAADKLDLSEPQPVADFPHSAKDIRAVISAFNRMQERIASLIKARMVMIGGFSHDVRTYATRLRLRVELIGDDAERARAIRDLDDMISLLDDALFAIQDRPSQDNLELVELASLLRDEVEDKKASGAKASFDDEGDAELPLVLGNPVALRRLFANLTDNAVTYGGEARVNVRISRSTLRIVVSDSGPGIPPEQWESVTDPFVRLEGSRNRKTGGAGLGLAIARKVAESHGGQLSIGKAESGGASVTVELPIFEAGSD